MNSILPIGIDTLLHGGVETAGLELKASWDEATTGPQVLKTICAERRPAAAALTAAALRVRSDPILVPDDAAAAPIVATTAPDYGSPV
ncbi:MAG: hypothetical protein IPK26_23350 [Planctomycetes bacterium]|nr:hypothetical protein [Planctomycetota bacterium]